MPLHPRHTTPALCREKVYKGFNAENRLPDGWQYCDVPARIWCEEDGMYVCRVHCVSKHYTHRLSGPSAYANRFPNYEGRS